MGSVLRSVGASQGNIWTVAPFIPVGPSEKRAKKRKIGVFSLGCQWNILKMQWNNPYIYEKRYFEKNRPVTERSSWIWFRSSVHEMSNVMKCQRSWNVKCHQKKANAIKWQMPSNIKCNQMSNIVKFGMSVAVARCSGPLPCPLAVAPSSGPRL